MASRDTHVRDTRVRDTSDPRQVKSEEDMAALKAHVERELLVEVLKTFAGRRVLFNVLARAQPYGDIVSNEIGEVNRFLGRRSVGLEVLGEVLTADPNVYMLMQKESAIFEEKYQLNIVDEEREDGY